MRVLYVVEATIAGVRRHVTDLARGIDRQRFVVAVACPPLRDRAHGDARFVADLHAADIDVIALPLRRAIDPPSDAAALARLTRQLRAGRYDVVHAHSSKAGFVARLAARAAGNIAAVYTPHGLYFLGLHSAAKRRFYLALEQFAARLSDRIIAVSAGEQALLLQHGIGRPQQVVCISNGIAPPPLPAGYDRAAQRRALGQTTDSLLIGSVARLTEQKNPFMFVDAAAHLLCNQPQARFVWCGSGELAEAAQQHAQARGIAHAVRWLGHREDAAPVLAALDMFWLTSHYEGAPYALLEALALRVPVVATDVVGTRDTLRGTNGLLVPPGDRAALARATLMLAEQPARAAALAQAGFRWYAEHGTVERMLRRTEQVYNDVILQRSSAQKRHVAARHV